MERVNAGRANQQQRTYENNRTGRTSGGRRVSVNSRKDNEAFSSLVTLISALFCCLLCCKLRDDETTYESSYDRGSVRRGRPDVVVNNPPSHVPAGSRNVNSHPSRANISPNVVQVDNRQPNNNGRGVNRGSHPGEPVIRQQVGADKNKR